MKKERNLNSGFKKKTIFKVITTRLAVTSQ